MTALRAGRGAGMTRQAEARLRKLALAGRDGLPVYASTNPFVAVSPLEVRSRRTSTLAPGETLAAAKRDLAKAKRAKRRREASAIAAAAARGRQAPSSPPQPKRSRAQPIQGLGDQGRPRLHRAVLAVRWATRRGLTKTASRRGSTGGPPNSTRLTAFRRLGKGAGGDPHKAARSFSFRLPSAEASRCGSGPGNDCPHRCAQWAAPGSAAMRDR